MEWVQRKIGSKELKKDSCTRIYLDASFQGVKRLFFLAFNDTTVNGHDYLNPINNMSNRVIRES